MSENKPSTPHRATAGLGRRGGRHAQSLGGGRRSTEPFDGVGPSTERSTGYATSKHDHESLAYVCACVGLETGYEKNTHDLPWNLKELMDIKDDCTLSAPIHC